MVGFNKDHQRLVFARFADSQSGGGFLAALEPNVSSAYDVKSFNALYKEVRARRHGEKGIIKATWTNIAFTFGGLQMLGPPDLGTLPQDFREGMAAQASTLGDVDESAPDGWREPFNVLRLALQIDATE